jgi:hypothetical protein
MSVDYIREHLEILDRLVRQPNGLQSPHRFMLDNGRTFQVTEHTFEGRRGTPKECYANAGRIMLQRPDNLFYAEGFVTHFNLPIPHGWLVTRQGHVIDPTLKAGDRTYFGLAFEQTYYLNAIARSGYWSLLTDGVTLHDIAHRRTGGMLMAYPPT